MWILGICKVQIRLGTKKSNCAVEGKVKEKETWKCKSIHFIAFRVMSIQQRGGKPFCTDWKSIRTWAQVRKSNSNSDLDSSPKNPSRGSRQKSKSQFGPSPNRTVQKSIRTWPRSPKSESEVRIQNSIMIIMTMIDICTWSPNPEKSKSQIRSPKVNSDLAQKSKSRIRSPIPKSEKSISTGAPLQQFGPQSEVRIRSPNVFKLKNKTAWPPPDIISYEFERFMYIYSLIAA